MSTAECVANQVKAMNADGDFGVACFNMRSNPFPYVVHSHATNGTKVMSKQCSEDNDQVDEDDNSSKTSIISFTLLCILLI